jgi:hypothetical protein
MFCPNCGQQQIANNTKFCPRCGTSIAGLAEWLAAGGATFVVRDAPAPAAPAAPAALSPRRKGMRRGAKVMFLSGVLLPFLVAMSAAVEHPLPFLFVLVIFFIGFSMTLYARIFGEDAPPAAKPAPAQQQLPGATAAALPPAADTRLNNFGRRGVRTAELSPPPSVTENTTRLLDDE